MNTINTTSDHRLQAIVDHLLLQKTALRNAIERAKLNALAGNGFAESAQAIADDDRAEERLQALLSKEGA